MNTGDFINRLFTDLGVSIDDASLKDLVTKVANTEISDDLVNKFNQGYFTEASAKANPRIQGHFKAQIYNGMDDELKSLHDEMGLPDEVKAEIAAISGTNKRAAALVRKVKELTEQKATASKGDKAEFAQQIEALNNEIKEIKKAAQLEKDGLKKDFDSKVDDLYLSQFLASQKYANDSLKDLNFMLPKSKIQKALEERGLKKILEGETFKLQTEAGTDYFENNTKVDFKTFAEKVLADNKYTSISEPSPQGGQQKGTIVTGNVDASKAAGLAKYQAMKQELSANSGI